MRKRAPPNLEGKDSARPRVATSKCGSVSALLASAMRARLSAIAAAELASYPSAAAIARSESGATTRGCPSASIHSNASPSASASARNALSAIGRAFVDQRDERVRAEKARPQCFRIALAGFIENLAGSWRLDRNRRARKIREQREHAAV